MELLIIFIIVGVLLTFLSSQSSKKKEKHHRKLQMINQNKIYDYLKSHELDSCKKFISSDYSSGIVLDEKGNRILLITKKHKLKDGTNEFNFDIIDTDKLMQSEIVIDDYSIHKTVRTSQLAGMAVGSILGVGGMIVGGLSANKIKQEKIKSISLKILIEDINSPSIKISFLPMTNLITGIEHKDGYSKNSSDVRTALNNIEKWYGITEVLMKQQNKVVNS